MVPDMARVSRKPRTGIICPRSFFDTAGRCATIVNTMRKIVLDIETKNTFQDVGKSDPAALDISVLVVYDYVTNKYIAYTEPEFTGLWKLLESTDLIIGYNSDYFDIPLLNKYYPGDLTKIQSLDLLAEIKKSLGKRIPLDFVAAGTLGKGKTGHGLDAITWWQQGNIDAIKKYCQADVQITKEVYDYALKNQSLKYKLVNEIITIPLDTGTWEIKQTSSLNYTLPL